MSENNQPQKTVDSVKKSDSRRSFLKKASIGAPIVITASTKPAWGAACMSGIMSGNLSNHTHTCDLSGGLSHGHWSNHYIGSTTGPIKNDGKKISSDEFDQHLGEFYYFANGNVYYTGIKLDSDLLGSYSFGDVIGSGGGDDYTYYLRELAVAYLNVANSAQVYYPYSSSDLAEVVAAVALGDADAREVGELLESFHSPNP